MIKPLIVRTLHDKFKALNAVNSEFVSNIQLKTYNTDILWVYSNDVPDEDVLRLIESKKNIVRKNIGRDYGAFYQAFQTYKNNYSHFIFLHDDVIFKNIDWLKEFINAFENGIEVCSPHVCTNFNQQKVPRGAFWAASTRLLNDISWAEPTNVEMAYEQEMNLLPGYMKKNNIKIAQLGNGTNLMGTKEYNYTNGFNESAGRHEPENGIYTYDI